MVDKRMLTPCGEQEREAAAGLVRDWNLAYARSMGHSRGVYVATFGCQQNQADSEKLLGMAVDMGYRPVETAEEADLILVNTCAIREHAENRALAMVGEYKHIRERNPDLIIGVCGCMVSQEHRRESLTGYYAALTAMDAAVGRILDRLEADGILDDTLIVFTGDNGMSMGHHGIWGKGNGTNPVNMYDSAVKVPGLFRLPGVVQENVVNHEMISHYDFYETILEMAGIPFEKPADMPGTSFAPLLTGKQQRVRDSVVIFDEYGPCRMIRTREWKLVVRIPNGPHELYDLVNDPGEETNRFGDPACREIMRTLGGELEDWFRQYVDPAFDGSKEAVCGRGQLTSHSFQ